MSDAFISYSRKDKEFGIKLHDALTNRGKDAFIDLRDIEPAAPFWDEIYAQILDANAFVFIISPDSVKSTACRQEIAYANAPVHSKRLIPILYRADSNPMVHPPTSESGYSIGDSTQSLIQRRMDVPVPEPLAGLNWIFFRDEDNFATSLDQLITAIETDLDWVKAHTRLLVRAKEWDNKKRDGSLLLRGTDLREAEEWQAQASTSKEPKLTALQAEYILASRKAATRQQRTLLTGVTVALIVAIILSVVVVFQADIATNAKSTAIAEANARATEANVRATAEANAISSGNARATEASVRATAELKAVAEADARSTEASVRATAEARAIVDRNIARSRELASFAAGQLNSDPELSLLLALEAIKASYTSEAEDVLRQALPQSYGFSVMRGHTGKVNSGLFTPDGQRVVTSSDDGSVKIWDTRTSKLLIELFITKAPITSLALSPDGELVAAAAGSTSLDHDCRPRVWEIKSGKLLAELSGPTCEVHALAFSPDGNNIIAPNDGNTARIWEARTGKLIIELGNRNEKAGGTKVAFSPNGQWAITAGECSSLEPDLVPRIWDVTTGKLVAELRSRRDASFLIRDVNFSPDGKYVVTACDMDSAIWEASTGHIVTELSFVSLPNVVSTAIFSPDGTLVATSSHNTARVLGSSKGGNWAVMDGHTDQINSVAFSSDGRLLVTASRDKTARVWDAITGKLIEELRGHTDSVNSAVFSPDGKFVLTASTDGTVRIWNVILQPNLVEFNAGQATDIELSPDGNKVVTVSNDFFGKDLSPKIWDANSGKMMLELTGHTRPATSAKFSHDGKLVVAGSFDGTARVWSAITGDTLSVLQGGGADIYDAEFSPDDRRVLTAGATGIWDTVTGKLITGLPTDREIVWQAQYSPDARLVVTCSDKRVQVWDPNSAKRLGGLSYYTNCLFNPIGNLLFSSDRFGGGFPNTRIWDPLTGQTIKELRGHTEPITSASFSSNNKYLATGSEDQTIRIWDVETWNSIGELRGHSGPINSVAFGPNSKILLTAGDQRALLWDVETGRLLKTIAEDNSTVTRAVFSSDGKRIATLSEKGIVQISPYEESSSLEGLIMIAQSRVTRVFTCDERRMYLHESIACPTPTLKPG